MHEEKRKGEPSHSHNALATMLLAVLLILAALGAYALLAREGAHRHDASAGTEEHPHK